MEVRFRRLLDPAIAENLHEDLMTQRTHWPDVYLVVMLGEPNQPGGIFHQDCVRVVRPEDGSGHNDATTLRKTWWTSLPQLPDIFPGLSGCLEQQAYLDSVTGLLSSLGSLPDPLRDSL